MSNYARGAAQGGRAPRDHWEKPGRSLLYMLQGKLTAPGPDFSEYFSALSGGHAGPSSAASHARGTIGLQASVDAGADAADDGMALMPVRYIKDAQTAYPTGDPNFAVKQSFPSVVGERESDPFLMCDEFGPTVSRRAYGNDTDAGFDVPWHPRRAAPRRCSRDPGWARDERTSPSCSVGTMAWIF